MTQDTRDLYRKLSTRRRTTEPLLRDSVAWRVAAQRVSMQIVTDPIRRRVPTTEMTRAVVPAGRSTVSAPICPLAETVRTAPGALYPDVGW
jgi:hypothetical protein